MKKARKIQFCITILKHYTFTLSTSNSPKFIEFFTGILQYTDKFIAFDELLETNRLFGLGERYAHFALPPGTYTFWNHGIPTPFDDGDGGKQIYGSHPFYVTQMNDKSLFYGVFFKNSNAQDAIIDLTLSKRYRVTHKTIGGIIELFIFYPSTLENILSKYHTLIGKPYLPPFWSFGHHHQRWGYRSIWEVKRALRGFDNYKIPLDSFTVDIDAMIEYEIFTIDNKTYPNIKEFADKLHKDNQFIVFVLDCGIKIKKGYKTYEEFIKQKAVIRSIIHPPFAEGSVWPGPAVFPDFFNPAAIELWQKNLKEFYELTSFDGLMVDMNDINTFCTGECPINDLKHEASNTECYFDPKNHPINEFNNLPYYPGGINLESLTLSNTGYHCAKNDYEDKFLKQYNLHSIFAYNETRFTSSYHSELTNKRTFMLPRSTSPGSGHYGSHWQGDDWATWSHLRLSIAGLFSFQLFGIPHIGNDITGFAMDGDAELSARWYQVGAFYTFTRQQHIASSLGHEPWFYDENPEHDPINGKGKNIKIEVTKAARNAIRQKYSILRLYYTQMILTHFSGGYVVGPLFFEFPNDDTAFKEIENSILVGKSVLVSFALYPGQKTINQYFPNNDWYELTTGKHVIKYNPKTPNTGTFIKLQASFEYNNMHLRGGKIIPYQDTTSTGNLADIMRAQILLNSPIEIIVGLNTHKADGTIIVEDGISPKIKETKFYKKFYLEFSNKNGPDTLFFTTVNEPNQRYKFMNEIISKIRIYGLNPIKLYSGAVLKYKNGQMIGLNATFDNNLHTAIITNNIEISMSEIKEIMLIEKAELKGKNDL